MANEQDKLQIEIVLDDGSVKTGFINVEKQAAKSASTMTKSFGDSFGSIKTAIIGVAAAIGAKQLFGKAIDEAIAAEKSNNAFAASLAQIGQYSKAAVESFGDYADALSAQTGISDDAIKQNASMLVTLGKLSGEGLNRATAASLDLAQALQVDMSTAFDMVAKAANGSVGTLGKYGIKVDSNLPQSQKFASILGQLESRFGGLAATNLNTFGGQLDNLGNSFNKIFEAVGGLFTGGGDNVLKKGMLFFSNFFREVAASIEAFGKSNSNVIAGMLDNVLVFGQILNTVLIRPIEFLGRMGYATFKAIISGLNAIIAAAANVGKAIYDYILKPLNIGKSMEDFIYTAAESTTEVMTESFAATREALANQVNGTITESFGGFIENFRTSLANTAAPMEEFKNNSAFAASETANAWNGASISIKESFNEVISGFKGAALELTKDKATMMKAFADVGKSALQGLAGSVGNAFSAFGKALVEGENAAQAFVNSFLGSIGQMLVQMGTSYILQGIAASANPLTPGMGGPLIAAGAAMAAFGGILSAIGGGKGSAAPSVGTGGGIAAEPSPTTELPTQEEVVQQQPNTEVQVVVNGSILDSDESGSRIISLINDAFDKKGVVIQRGVMA